MSWPNCDDECKEDERIEASRFEVIFRNGVYWKSCSLSDAAVTVWNIDIRRSAVEFFERSRTAAEVYFRLHRKDPHSLFGKRGQAGRVTKRLTVIRSGEESWSEFAQWRASYSAKGLKAPLLFAATSLEFYELM